jgi:hypothetical protein
MRFLNVFTGRLSPRQYAEAHVLVFLSRIGGVRERLLNFLQSTMKDRPILCLVYKFCNIDIYIAIMYVCMYVCMYTCIYVCMYVYMYV